MGNIIRLRGHGNRRALSPMPTVVMPAAHASGEYRLCAVIDRALRFARGRAACPALSRVAVPVGGVIRVAVAVRAMITSGVANHVLFVLGTRTPREILKPVIVTDIIEVPGFHTVRLRADERLQDKVIDEPSLLTLTIGEADRSASIWMPVSANAASRSVRPNSPLIGYRVPKLPPGHWEPSFDRHESKAMDRVGQVHE